MSTAVKYPKPNIIVAAVPEHNLAYRGVRFAKKNGIPCMVDLRDPWPDFFLDFVRSPVLKLFVRLFLVKDYYRSRYTLKNADSVVSMMDSLLRWGQIKGRRTLSQMDRVFYLGANEPNIADTKDLEPEFCDMINRVKGRFNALFLGTVNNYYNPVTIVRAARILNDRIKEGHRINCIIAGSGDLLEETIREAKGMPNVLFTGWVDEKKISALLSNSTVGIIPAQLETDVFPNKAFTYFSGGLPVISSAVGELAALISKKRLGLNFERENHVQLAEILIELIKNPLRIADIKANVARTFEDEFSVPRIYGKFVEHVEAVATKRLSVSK
jgi:glycosyltransferase involved in cell wall biosynthesis